LVEAGLGVRELAANRHEPDVLARLAGVGRLPGQNDTKNGAEPEHIGAFVEAVELAARLLRGHECRRAEHAAGERIGIAWPRGLNDGSAADLRAGRRLVRGAAAFWQLLGQAPIHHLHLAKGPHHHVGWLQVAV
jgi:hypothetical protein